MVIRGTPLRDSLMASERVEERVKRTAAALDAAGIPYAVIGGNAVRVWVATRDRGAVRATRDVDILVNEADGDRITEAMRAIGFRREVLRSLTVFVDPLENDRRTGVHLVWAGKRVRPSSPHAAPGVDERVRAVDEGFWVATLPALLRLKLTAFRLKDQVHLVDMLDVGLIDDAARATLPPDLLARLREVEARREAEE